MEKSKTSFKTLKELEEYLESTKLEEVVKSHVIFTLISMADLERGFKQQKLASHVYLTLLLVQSLVILLK